MSASVLIVDDELEPRDAIHNNLRYRYKDWKFFLAADEDRALEVLADRQRVGQPIQVVVTDLVMKNEHSGIDLLDRTKQLDGRVAVILATAKETSLDRAEAIRRGAFAVIEKNMLGRTAALREIASRIEAALQSREATACAVARLEGIDEQSPLIVGRPYRLSAGIKNNPLVGSGQEASPADPVVIDVAVRAAGMDIRPAWLQRLTLAPGTDPEPLTFTVTPREAGARRIEVEFYYKRHWLTQVALTARVIDPGE